MILIRRSWLVCVVLALAGCAAVGPDFIEPEAPAPDAWEIAQDSGLKATPYELIEWWEVFNDPVLNQLVDIAHQQNYSLELAGLKVLESRAQLGIAVGTQYPQQQLASGGVTRISPSENAGQGNTAFSQYDLGASLAWEMDFWGKFRRGIESADAALAASIANYDGAMVLVTAQVASNYVTIRILEEQLRIADENLKLQQRSYDIAEVLYRNGQDSELDVQQAKSLLLGTQATVPDLKTQLSLSQNALNTLLGQTNGFVEKLISSGSIPDVPEQVAVGIPADLLRRRPDLRQAELQAVAQNAQVGVATADLYPSIALSGSLGVVSISKDVGGGGSSSLFSSDSVSFSTRKPLLKLRRKWMTPWCRFQVPRRKRRFCTMLWRQPADQTIYPCCSIKRAFPVTRECWMPRSHCSVNRIAMLRARDRQYRAWCKYIKRWAVDGKSGKVGHLWTKIR